MYAQWFIFCYACFSAFLTFFVISSTLRISCIFLFVSNIGLWTIWVCFGAVVVCCLMSLCLCRENQWCKGVKSLFCWLLDFFSLFVCWNAYNSNNSYDTRGGIYNSERVIELLIETPVSLTSTSRVSCLCCHDCELYSMVIFGHELKIIIDTESCVLVLCCFVGGYLVCFLIFL